MSEYCDTTRSPCLNLIKEIGKGVVIDKKTNRFFLRAWTKDTAYTHQRWIQLLYCPFCGCRLEILEV